MKRAIDLMKKVQIRRFITTFVVGALLFNVSTIGYGNWLRSPAIPLTVDTSSYRVTDTNILPETSPEKNIYTGENRHKDLIENSREQLRTAADDVRGKLNPEASQLDSTKNLVDSTKEKIERTINPE